MKKYLVILCSYCFASAALGQEADSSKNLSEVIVKAFEQNRSVNSVTAAVKILDATTADRYNKSSLVNGFNTIAGVRMEERSPGSYRINIRGSSLRSPFGVRNVKVYWNDIPVTDPGGNTYFNQFAFNNFSSIEIFKGPAGSLYGAGTGGLILMNTLDRWQPGESIEYVTGSYNLQNIFASARFGSDENKNQITYAHNQSDGYRVQTAMRRDNFSWTSQLKSTDKQKLAAAVLFTDMYYETPGALTLAEFNNNPKAARPAGGGFPSAVGAKAAIYQKNILAGITNQYVISSTISNTTNLYAGFAQIRNSAIRNYERRNEPQFGGRTTFTWTKKQALTEWKVAAGTEFQQGYFNTQVSKNKNGNPDTIQTNDDIDYTAYSFFLQGDVDFNDKWIATAGASLNKSRVSFSRLSVYPVIRQSRSYENELTPRFSLLRKFQGDFSVTATVSKGFSPPTVAELLPSTGAISTDLEAEQGWDYELTLRQFLLQRKLQVEVTGYLFRLNKALVQRRDLSGADYFVNAGDIREQGLEAHADYAVFANSSRFVNSLILRADYTNSHYRYGDFKKGADDFSGKTVPSVPASTFAAETDLQLKMGIYANITYYGASKIYLNDANTAAAKAYHLLGLRLGWKKTFQQKIKLNLYAGADNLLDEHYSLGNDINAAANRFYNAAAGRNYYVGISLTHQK